MNRQLHNAMIAQYATPSVSGDGLVSWDNGVKCVIPSVKMMGAATQGTLTGKNLLDKSKFSIEALRKDTAIKGFNLLVMDKSYIASMLEAGKTYTASCTIKCVSIPDSSFSPSGKKKLYRILAFRKGENPPLRL